jgi:hypothetical protein
MKRNLRHFAVGILLTSTIVSSIAFHTGNTVNASYSTVTSKSSGNTKTLDKVYKINEDVKIGNTIIKVLKVKSSSGTKEETPKSGKEYVIVYVKIKNAGKSKITYDPYNFQLINSKGEKSKNVLTSINLDTTLSSNELAPNKEAQGSLCFESVKGDKSLILTYKDDSLLKTSIVKIRIR